MVSFVNGIGKGEEVTVDSGIDAGVSGGSGKLVDVRALVQATRMNSGTTMISERAGGFIVSVLTTKISPIMMNTPLVSITFHV